MTPYLLHHLIENAAERFQHHVALVQAPGETSGLIRSLTYAELERESRGIAFALRQAGLLPGQRVGVWMRKSPAAVAVLLGILRAGGVYVPFDPLSPPRRVQALAADCELQAMFAEPQLLAGVQHAASWPPSLRTVFAADSENGLRFATAGEPALLPDSPATSDDLAYILYTSGSTGAPKGVMLTHAHALNFLRWATDEVDLQPEDRVASHAPLHFDLSIFDIWGALSRGATVHLLDPVTARFPAAVADWIRRQGITVWYSVPSALVRLLPSLLPPRAEGAPPAAEVRLRTIIFAGEVFPAASLRAWRRALPHASFLNWFGPTETNVCTHYRIPNSAEELSDPLPIGQACPNFDFAILDDKQRPVGPRRPGFLWVRGPGVFAGYWNDLPRTRSCTESRMVSGGPVQRWYNTGDVVCLDLNHQLYFQGRRDDLIKCRGYRISLSEVQNVLLALNGVRQAAVLAGPDAQHAEWLQAFIATEDPNLNAFAIRAFCATHLPAYSIPEHIEIRPALPETSTGKVDRRRLRADLEQRLQESRAALADPGHSAAA